jgi:hypothetical protein
MSILRLPFAYGGRPIIELYVGINPEEIQSRKERNDPIPATISVRALIDTGCSQTCIEERVLIGLGLIPVGETLFRTPSIGPQPISAYEYAVEIASNEETVAILASNLRVVGVQDLGGPQVEALLGRDVLNECLMVYDGPARHLSLEIATIA